MRKGGQDHDGENHKTAEQNLRDFMDPAPTAGEPAGDLTRTSACGLQLYGLVCLWYLWQWD